MSSMSSGNPNPKPLLRVIVGMNSSPLPVITSPPVVDPVVDPVVEDICLLQRLRVWISALVKLQRGWGEARWQSGGGGGLRASCSAK